MFKYFLISFSLFILARSVSVASYTPSEMFVINWGPASNELKISEAAYNDYMGTPEDSLDDYVELGGGPSDAFVDITGNVIFSSYDFGQLKGFDHYGELIFDYSHGEAGYNPGIFSRSAEDYYVDSLLNIYVVDSDERDFVAVADYNGNLLEKLYPFGPDSTIPILSMYPKFDGSITFYGENQRMVTYYNGQFINGGTPGFLAANGSFYSAKAVSPQKIKFNKFENPDSYGVAETRLFSEIQFPADSFHTAIILDGGDGNRLFTFLSVQRPDGYEVWELDLSYNRLDRISIQLRQNKYLWGVNPFIALDNTIYEFRCLDDGLHVIKWTKQ